MESRSRITLDSKSSIAIRARARSPLRPMITTLEAADRNAYPLHRGQEETEEDRDNCDHHQKFDERES